MYTFWSTLNIHADFTEIEEEDTNEDTYEDTYECKGVLRI